MHTTRLHRIRLAVAAAAVTVLFALLSWRLYVIQIRDHAKYRDRAHTMHRFTERIPAYRGTIRLRDGVIVARDVIDYEVGLDPNFMPMEKIQQVVKLVCDGMGKSPEYRRERLRTALAKKESGRSAYLHLVSHVPESMVEEIRGAVARLCTGEEMRGLAVRPRAHRVYPRGTLGSSVVGVVDAQNRGVQGIEASMQPYLYGRDGRRVLLWDAEQKIRIYDLEGAEVAPVAGHDVYLTIDSRLQAIVESELEAGIRREKAEAGSFVLMDCNNGDILAMASWPTYDPNRFREYPKAERDRRRYNRPVEKLCEPGSVIKPYLAAYVLDRGICGRHQLVRELAGSSVHWDGGARALFGRRVVRDVHAHENLTLERAVIYSSNISMAIVGLHAGRDHLVEMLTGFGLCRPTGIDLPAEGRGKYTDAGDWSPLYSSVSVSFGYEVMVTPLQLCRALAAVVNGGYLLRPRIVTKVSRWGKEESFPEREVVGRPIREETSRQMREILLQVVEEGTAKYLKIQGFQFGGKTGTADMGRGGYDKSDYLASFEAFAPYEKPAVVAICMIEKPRGGSYYGSIVAGPIVAEVFRRMFHLEERTLLARLRGTGG